MQVPEIYYDLATTLRQNAVQLTAVSKKQDAATIRKLYDAGQRDFGENYVQELIAKAPDLPNDIRWHFIGHLQTNKVKYIAPFITTIESVDSYDLLAEIQKQATRNGRTIEVLLQLFVAEEDTKFGMDEKEIFRLLDHVEAQSDFFQNIRICGLMAMGSFTEDTTQLKTEFDRAQAFYQHMRDTYFFRKPWFNRLSMGMSGDYKLAIACGSNEVRIGSLIFGARG